MTALNKYAALRQLAEESTQGEWWSDVVETDGEYGDGEDRASGYHSYAVYVGNESLLDMTNSTAACIHTEWDHDYLMAWDETAKRNAEFIAAANPATVLALLSELESAEKRIAELEAREVEFPKPHAHLIWIQAGHAPDDFWDDVAVSHSDKDRCCDGSERYPVYAKWEIEEMLAAAGIGVKGD